MSSVNDSIRKRFIECIEEVRRDNKQMRSNLELAKKLRTASPRITEWEKGIRMPTIEHIYYLCKEFGKSPAFIFLGERQTGNEITSELRSALKRIGALEQAIKIKPLRKTG